MSGAPERQETPARGLAEEYLKRGGTRRAVLDDNNAQTRDWEDSPKEAEEFWQKNIESLSDDRRREVISHLPSLNVT